jgi:hypothetical protein
MKKKIQFRKEKFLLFLILFKRLTEDLVNELQALSRLIMSIFDIIKCVINIRYDINFKIVLKH